jgi:hypothetical protein
VIVNAGPIIRRQIPGKQYTVRQSVMIMMIIIIIKSSIIIVPTIGGGGGFNNIAFPHDLTSRPGFATNERLVYSVNELIEFRYLLL